MAEQTRCRIISGPSDWQILQQDDTGHAEISLAGTWSLPEDAKAGAPIVRAVREDTYAPVSAATDWQDAETGPDQTWAAQLRVPAGGLYRIESGVKNDDAHFYWTCRGDIIHNIGVGDLWVIAGQSNASGYGRGEIDDPPELGVHFLRNDEQWCLATHPLNEARKSDHPNVESLNPGHSPFLVFAKRLKHELGYPIGLIQTACGGTTLSQWNPAEDPDSLLYRNLLHCVGLANDKIKGICWYQGCGDANREQGISYLERFEQLVEALRSDIGDPQLPILTVQIDRITSDEQADMAVGWNAVREAQRQAAHLIPNLAVVPTIDLPVSDFVHLAPAGNMLLGGRLSAAALGMVYGKDVHWLAPEICQATAESGRRSVRLAFKNVPIRLFSDYPVTEDFVVEDGGGILEIEDVTFSSNDEILIVLRRPVGEGAVVHGCYGPNPRNSVYEMATHWPPLAFHQFSIEL